MVAHHDPAAGIEGAVYFSIQRLVLRGTVLMNDGRQKGEVVSRRQLVLVKISGRQRDAADHTGGLHAIARHLNHRRQVEQSRLYCRRRLEKSQCISPGATAHVQQSAGPTRIDGSNDCRRGF